MMKKAVSKRPKPIKQPQTFELDQSYLLPPHVRAINRQTKPAVRSVAPGKSHLTIFCFNGRSAWGAGCGLRIFQVIPAQMAPTAARYQLSFRSLAEKAFTLTKVDPT
jgi:hypothetical protein